MSTTLNYVYKIYISWEICIVTPEVTHYINVPIPYVAQSENILCEIIDLKITSVNLKLNIMKKYTSVTPRMWPKLSNYESIFNI